MVIKLVVQVQSAKTEKNDCVVRAIANACDVNYEQAHQYCVDTFDREDGKGVTGFSLIMKMNNEMVFDEVGQLNLFQEGVKRTVKHVGDKPKMDGDENIGGTLINPKYKHKSVAYTVKEFAQRFKTGNYILAVAKHALAIKNGVVIDNGNYQVGGYRRVVESAFMVA
tara:strand:+ start:593 stop:1093 length:501 start_codon:yes stop_codon:yes gene_type:complete